MLYIILFALLSLTSCVSSTHRELAKLERRDVDALTLELAVARRAQIQKIDYDLFLKVDKNASTYRFRVDAHLILDDIQKPLSFDYVGKKVERITVNGELVEDFHVQTGSIEIPAKYLKPQMDVSLEGVNEYTKTGVGFQRSVDVQDGQEYLFTDFEPYDGHLFVPLIDQPDLKAKFRVTVEAPSDWKAVGNTPIANTKAEGERATTTFQETKPISTYLLFVGLGPFAVWEDQCDHVPLRIFARQSLAKFVDHQALFDTTKKGMKFYSDYFGYPYPFFKYDQIFVPEFMSGGMENVGAVVLNERHIPRGQMESSSRFNRDSLILHEMAHMWFGDLVTMRWWNDLWLNESFATYAASLALERALGSKDAGVHLLFSKAAAYHQDSSVSTHPIETPVTDTATAMANFDNITYGKGASVLKQLHFTVGEKAFREGLNTYFKKYEYQNTTRHDFTSTIGKAWGQDLDAWAAPWLQSAGPNRVRADWACKDGQISKFDILQKPNKTGSLAAHKTRIGLYQKSKNELKVFRSAEIKYDTERSTVPSLIGSACPDFVNLNVGDFDYAVVELDSTTLTNAKFGLSGGLRDPLDRASLWQILDEMVYQGQLPVSEYFDIAAASLKFEPNALVVRSLAGRYSMMPRIYFRFLTSAQQDQAAAALEEALEERLSDLQFFDIYIFLAKTPRALNRLHQFLNGRGLPKGIQVDQDRRWEILLTLAREGVAGIDAMISEERKRDQTTSGAKYELAARAVLPSRAAKREFWTKMTKGSGTPFQDLRYAAEQFSLSGHPEYFEPLMDDYFSYLETVEWTNLGTAVNPVIQSMFPLNTCSPELLRRSEASLKAASSLSSFARRVWLQSNEDLEHCIRIRAESGH